MNDLSPSPGGDPKALEEVSASATIRILLIKLGAIGDVVATLPLLHRLRAGIPGATIAWAVEPRALPLLEGHPELDRVIVHRRRGLGDALALVGEIRRGRFDIVVDLQRILKSGLLMQLSGARRRIGFDRARCKEMSHLFASERLPPRSAIRPMVEQYLEFADLLGVPASRQAFVLPSRIADAPPAPSDVVIGIGAGKPANRWPAVRFAMLVRDLQADGLSVVLLGAGLREERTAREIARFAPGPIDIRVGATTIPEVAGLLRGARVYVGLDSGLTHLACALGTSVVALYGAADERRTGPYGPHARVVRTRPTCAPCGRRHCPLGRHVCMVDLSPADVAAEVRERLLLKPPLAAAPTASRT